MGLTIPTFTLPAEVHVVYPNTGAALRGNETFKMNGVGNTLIRMSC